jgi:hypothetical protein
MAAVAAHAQQLIVVDERRLFFKESEGNVEKG